MPTAKKKTKAPTPTPTRTPTPTPTRTPTPTPTPTPRVSSTGRALDPQDGRPIFRDGMSRKRYLAKHRPAKRAAIAAELRESIKPTAATVAGPTGPTPETPAETD